MSIKKRFPSEKLDQYIVRLPDGMRDRLKQEAARNNRSLNAEIVSRLSFSLGLDLTPDVPGHDRIEPHPDDIIDTLERVAKQLSLMKLRGEFGDNLDAAPAEKPKTKTKVIARSKKPIQIPYPPKDKG